MAQPSRDLLEKVQQARNIIEAKRDSLRQENLNRLDNLPRQQTAAPTQGENYDVQPPADAAQAHPDTAALLQRLEEAERQLQQQNQHSAQQQARLTAELDAERQAAQLARKQAQDLGRQITQSRPPTDAEIGQYFTQEQMDRIGMDGCREMFMLQRRIASDITQSEVQVALKTANEALEKAEERAIQAQWAAFNAEVTSLCPDWRKINDALEFRKWLQNIDPATGLSYKQLGDEAGEKLDVKRRVAIFDMYKASLKASDPQPQTGLLPDSRSTIGVATNISSQKAQFTPQDVEDMNQKLRTGFYRNKPDQLAADKQRLMTARR